MKKLDLNGIKNIIFDLGMVIINLDKEATPAAFKKLAGNKYEAILEGEESEFFFNQYETGKISTAEFIETLKNKIGNGCTSKDVENAWNAMLKDIPEKRFEILVEAKNNYRTFCLSNTNELHIDFIFNELQQNKGLKNLDSFFEKVYLSHEMGQRKPDVEIFETVIRENDLNPSETLFIDDTAGHMEGARKAGLKTFHLAEGIILEQLF